MSPLRVDPTQFVPEALSGFCDLYREFVQPVPGGVVRARLTRRPGKVAVVVGGGSGHYPAFAGYVGPGMADAAVVGNVFASPSTRQVRDVARAADQGGGVLLAYGNYAGDVLNFSLAVERLRGEGIAAEQVAVTDDVASAQAAQRELRRGVAGDLVVFKIAGAAAERGDDLATVTRLARTANLATYSFGVAFGGCTVPGSDAPLFELPKGMMGVGLGVHGEPGISEQPVPTAEDLAALLVDRLLAEAPAEAGARPVAILNGLGTTKHEQLFQLWYHVRRCLDHHGIAPAATAAGELITSLDMGGCSLTLAWLDDEGLELWNAPVQTPGVSWGQQIASWPAPRARIEPAAPLAPAREGGSAEAVAVLAEAFADVAGALADAEPELNRLDAVAGDGDHGRSVVAGARAAQAVAAEGARVGADLTAVLAAAADAWCDASGGTSGALWSAGLRAAAAQVEAAASDEVDVAAAARSALEALGRFGGAEPGDKTMLDAIVPFIDVLESAGWTAAAEAAEAAARATADLRPRVGRARPLAERSLGHPDPGATSFAISAGAAARVIDRKGVHHD